MIDMNYENQTEESEYETCENMYSLFFASFLFIRECSVFNLLFCVWHTSGFCTKRSITQLNGI